MFSAVSEANEHRLVRGSKSSTNFLESMQYIPDVGDYAPEAVVITDTGEHDAHYPELDISRAGKWLRVSHEEWSGKYQATAYVQTTYGLKPPAQEGDRLTDQLSKAAQRKIDNSAKWLSKNRRGYTAFITLTFNPEQRAMLALHDKRGAFELHPAMHGPVIPNRTSIGKECTRFLNALQQVKKRGMVLELANGEKGFMRGTGSLFQYCWVIENPWRAKHTDYGPERVSNPHVHLMMNWTVKRKFFKGWAARIEKLWGQGYAHIERLRKPASAAAYMAKAANYISKGADGSQGRVRGNRYSISQGARAPLPKLIECYALQFLREAIRLGVELGRKAWPKGLYFYQHGFGATDRTAWGSLWTALKRDGFRFITARDLFVERMQQKITAWCDVYYRDPMPTYDYRRYCDYMLKPLKAISLDEFERAHATH